MRRPRRRATSAPGPQYPSPMLDRRPSLAVLFGVGLVAGSTLALQVLLTRVFAAVLFYHFGFLAISLALLGVGAGAILIYVRPGLVRARSAASGRSPAGAWCTPCFSWWRWRSSSGSTSRSTESPSASWSTSGSPACSRGAAVPRGGIVIALAVRGYVRVDREGLRLRPGGRRHRGAAGGAAHVALRRADPGGAAGAPGGARGAPVRRADACGRRVLALAVAGRCAAARGRARPQLPRRPRPAAGSPRSSAGRRSAACWASSRPPRSAVRAATASWSTTGTRRDRPGPRRPLPDWRALQTGPQSVGYALTGPRRRPGHRRRRRSRHPHRAHLGPAAAWTWSSSTAASARWWTTTSATSRAARTRCRA